MHKSLGVIKLQQTLHLITCQNCATETLAAMKKVASSHLKSPSESHLTHCVNAGMKLSVRTTHLWIFVLTAQPPYLFLQRQ